MSSFKQADDNFSLVMFSRANKIEAGVIMEYALDGMLEVIISEHQRTAVLEEDVLGIVKVNNESVRAMLIAYAKNRSMHPENFMETLKINSVATGDKWYTLPSSEISNKGIELLEGATRNVGLEMRAVMRNSEAMSGRRENS